jgi:hypothetical protein
LELSANGSGLDSGLELDEPILLILPWFTHVPFVNFGFDETNLSQSGTN